MGTRAKFEDKIKKKEQEIQEYETLIREAKAYLLALQDAIKLLPRDDGTNGITENLLRKGSNIGKTYNFLRQLGKPAYIDDILKAIGKNITKKERVSLSGSLAAYVRKNEFFTRPAPNTFGLKNMEEVEDRTEPPDDFGIIGSKETKEANFK
jgi:hypothetical protein